MEEGPVIYRAKALTILAILGDQRAELEQIRRLLEVRMAKKKRKPIWTPEERAEFERRSPANLKRLRELIDRGWEELERKGVAMRPS